MSMAEPAPAPPLITDTCTSVSRSGGWRCTGRANHRETLHRFGAFLWDDKQALPPSPPPAVENVLRLAAVALLPYLGMGAQRASSLASIADLVRDFRRDRYFDVETAGAIESWLAVYEGREVVR
jgi:hypothetical protein